MSQENVMSIRFEDVEVLQDEVPGSSPFEEAWGRVYVALIQHLDKWTKDRVLGINWPCEIERDDFISQTMMQQYYRHRAEKGTLFATYVRDKGNPIAFIASQKFLRHRAVDHLAKLANRQVNRNITTAMHLAARPLAPECGDLCEQVQEQLGKLVLHLPEGYKIDRTIEQAALQLYPRLDWTTPSLCRLKDHLIATIREPCDGEPDRIGLLGNAHAKAQKAFDVEADQLAAKLHHDGAGLSPRQDRSVRDQQIKLWAQRFVYPLAAVTVADLFVTSRDNADQLRHRYIGALPKLMPKLNRLMECFSHRREHRVDEVGYLD